MRFLQWIALFILMQIFPKKIDSWTLLCLNCLSNTHKTNFCVSKHKWRSCAKSHNTLLHFDFKPNTQRANVSKILQNDPISNDIDIVQANVATQATSVLLATALIGVYAKDGSRILLRALIDQGSQSAFVSENAVQTLRLKRNRINATVSGIGAKLKKC